MVHECSEHDDLPENARQRSTKSCYFGSKMMRQLFRLFPFLSFFCDHSCCHCLPLLCLPPFFLKDLLNVNRYRDPSLAVVKSLHTYKSAPFLGGSMYRVFRSFHIAGIHRKSLCTHHDPLPVHHNFSSDNHREFPIPPLINWALK